ncbi:MAG TPA: DNA primase, partial [Thermomicrobiaceae bacterium]|nr:DNA primase [Thermomicrobiaceae bacterium]
MSATNVVDRVRERSDIVEIIGQHVQLRKAAKNFKGLCPFHQEKTPSFTVYPDSQHFHCFGCGAGGDVFSFVMQVEHVDFREALRELAQRAGVELEQAPPPSPEVVERHARLFELNARAATFFTHVLWSTPNGEPGRELLERRGVDRATAERFQLGFAPDRWDALLTVLGKRGVAPEDLIEAGLATAREGGGGAYDRFRNRLIFPIHDREGRTVGFGGRALGDAQPKYLNSPQTAIFDKGANLYALDLAQEAIRRLREVVVVEGYMDAIAAHQFGFTNVVASMGTALTEEQVRLVRRSVDRIVLALDADAAGQMATVRGLDVMRGALAETDRIDVEPVGLVRFERTLKTDIRIVRLPSGKDPDELIRADADAWRSAVAEPVPLLDFYVDAVTGDTPPSDPREKSERVSRLVPLLREVADPVVREHYVKLVARRLDVDENLVRRARPASTTRRPRLTEPPQRARSSVSTEDHVIALLVTFPEVLKSIAATLP